MAGSQKNNGESSGGQGPAGSGRGVKLMPNQNPVEEVYVDGVLGMFARAGVVKFNLYRVVGTDPGDESEVRAITHRLVMPAAALPELARLIQNMARAAAEQGTAAQAGQVAAPEEASGTAKPA
jgi:hypothetical protein